MSDSVRPHRWQPTRLPIPGILQARTLEWVAISSSNAWKWKVKVKLLSHVWLSDPMDCSLPGSSVHGIFQARVLEWGAIALQVENKVFGIRKLQVWIANRACYCCVVLLKCSLLAICCKGLEPIHMEHLSRSLTLFIAQQMVLPLQQLFCHCPFCGCRTPAAEKNLKAFWERLDWRKAS